MGDPGCGFRGLRGMAKGAEESLTHPPSSALRAFVTVSRFEPANCRLRDVCAAARAPPMPEGASGGAGGGGGAKSGKGTAFSGGPSMSHSSVTGPGRCKTGRAPKAVSLTPQGVW